MRIIASLFLASLFCVLRSPACPSGQTAISTPNYVYPSLSPTSVCVPNVYASTLYLNIYNQLATKDCTSMTGGCTPAWPNPPGNSYVGIGDEPDFNNYVQNGLTGTAGSPMLAGQLTAANATSGPNLLSSSTLLTAQMQIALWKATGATAMFVQVGFPMLYAPFMATTGTNYGALFSSFYGAIARLIRAQGMKVCVELIPPLLAGPQLSGGNWPSLQDYYNSLTTVSAYATARAGQVTAVIQAMQPDYLVIMEEPDTETGQTGQDMVNLANAVQVVNAAITAARNAATTYSDPTLKIGAGFGTWLQAGASSCSGSPSSCVNSYLDFTQGFTHQNCSGTAQSGGTITCLASNNSNNCGLSGGCYLDFLDIHVFPIPEQPAYCTASAAQFGTSGSCPQPQFWYNAVSAVTTAAGGTCGNQSGSTFACPFAISQAWLRKIQAQNTQTTSGYDNDDWPSNYVMTGGSGASACSYAGNDCLAGDIQEARETFSFWSTLDLDFVFTLWTMAQTANGLYVAPFNTQNLTGMIVWGAASFNLYPDGDGSCAFPCGQIQPNTLFYTVQANALSGLLIANYTAWATGFHDLVTGGQGPSSLPTVPTGVAAVMTSGSAALVTWNASTDPVGVAGYQVARDGNSSPPIAPGLLLNSFIDTGIVTGSHWYQVRAFNLGYEGTYQYSDWTGAVALRAQPAVAAVGQTSINGRLAVQ